MPISKNVLNKSRINQQNVNKKSTKYYIKDGIKCTKRDIKRNMRELRYLIGDLIVGCWKLLTVKVKRKRKGEKDNG